MTAIDKTARSQTESLWFEVELPHAPAKVWRALTDPALVAEWLMPNDFRAEVGHRFTMRAQPVGGWDGVVRCEVLEVIPRARLRYTWVGGAAGNDAYGAPLDTVVTWSLTPTAGGTLLRLEHAGFGPKNAFAFEMMGQGWRGRVGARLGETLAGLP